MKKQNKYILMGLVLVGLGVILLLAAWCVHLVQEQQDAQAGESASLLLEELQAAKVSKPTVLAQTPVPELSEESPSLPTEMPSKVINGYETLGVLFIPTLGIELPILNNWTYDLLKVSPCRYSGTAEGGNLILMGHNYRSHFRPLKELSPGDEVLFTDINDVCYTYTVDQVEILHKTEGEYLSSDHDLIVFTCVQGGEERIVVRCSRTE